jgi:RHS repeat-associated protein
MAMVQQMPKAIQDSLEASLRQTASEGMAQAKKVLPKDFDTTAAEETFLMTRNALAEDEAKRPVTVRYFHCDHLGTPMALSDDKGKIVWRAEYDPWGNVVEEFNPDGIEQNIRFQGQHFDQESGLHYNRHRYYDPKLGSYINQDPIGLAGGINTYAFVEADPLGYIDPTGLKLVVVGDTAFKTAVNADLRTLKSTPSGKQLYKNLKKSKKTHKIVQTSGGNSCSPARNDYAPGKRSGSTINYNPSGTQGGMDANGSTTRPSYVGLGHEMGHSEGFNNGTQVFDRGSGTPGTTPPSETNSIARENQIRSEHGLSNRPSYY